MLGIYKGLSAPMVDQPHLWFSGDRKKIQFFEVGMYFSIELYDEGQ